MTPNEAGQILAMMQSNWPRVASNDLAAQEWINDLIGMESAPAIEAYRTLRAGETRSPSWAVFLEAYQMHRRRLAPRQELDAGYDEPPPTEAAKQRVHELVAGLAAQLRLDSAKKRMPMRAGPRKTPELHPEPLDLKSRAADRVKRQGGGDMATFDEVYAEEQQ